MKRSLLFVIATIFTLSSFFAFSDVSVEEIYICKDVIDREPVGSASGFSKNVEKLYCWTKITGVTSGAEVVKHVWYYGDREMSSVSLTIKGSPWRTWTSKKIVPSWSGTWTVKIFDSEDNEIKQVTFVIGDIEDSMTEEEKVTEDIIKTVEKSNRSGS